MSKATAVAQSTMEQIRQAGYTGAASSSEQPVTGYPGLTRKTDITSAGVPGAKAVKVTVKFISFGQHTVEMNTILAR
jgi:hypothetical protein